MRHSRDINSPEDLMADEAASFIITRQFEIIGEAMRYLIECEDLKDYILPKWRKIVDFRNVVIHEYFGISYRHVFDIVKTEVPKLEAEMIEFIKKISHQESLLQAFEDFKTDLVSMNRYESIAYLERIQGVIKK